MIFSKHRFEIWSAAQHPYKHSVAEFAYSNSALPGVTNIEGALNWILAVLYPDTKAAVADLAALNALVGNTINDYRVVLDDGDGKAASYRWEQREGEVSASWHKIYDMDWGAGTILEAFQNRTQDLYVHKRGYDDLDDTGAVVAGLYAGQVVTGGLSASSNLTLRANSGDGTGARTGYVQFDDQVRPTVTATFDLGGGSYKFKDAYLSGSAYVGTMTLAGGSITDSSGTISFNDENLTTTGNVNAANVTASAVVTGTTSVNTPTLKNGAASTCINLNARWFYDAAGNAVGDFNDTYLSAFRGIALWAVDTSGIVLLRAPVSAVSGYTIFFPASQGSSGTFLRNDGSGNCTWVSALTTLGAIGSSPNANGATISGNTLNLEPASASFGGVVTTGTQTMAGAKTFSTSVAGGNLQLASNVLSSTDTNGNITFTPNGTGQVISSAILKPGGDNTLTLGTAAARWSTLYIGTGIHDGTTSISSATLQSLRDINSGVSSGMSLFYDGSKWVASLPDTEVDHGTISGLSDDDHTQYMLLAGRAGGQALVGGTAASEHITLESTSHGTKGYVKTKDDFVPNTNASYSGGWSGTNLGGASNYFKDVYTKGEFFGFRMENKTVATLPSPSAQNVGRVVFATDNTKAYVDTGTTFKVLGVSKSVTDTSWNGSDLTKNVTVSADVSDARNCIWQLRDNANDFEILGVKITTPNATTVTITTTIALPSGTYRLIGVE